MTDVDQMKQPLTILSSSNPTTIADAINRALEMSFAIYIKTTSFRLHLAGQNFLDYNVLLNQQASQTLEVADAMAEWIRTMGSPALSLVGESACRHIIEHSDASVPTAAAMLDELYSGNLLLVAALRRAKALADEVGNNATSGLIDGWTNLAEERARFLDESGFRP